MDHLQSKDRYSKFYKETMQTQTIYILLPVHNRKVITLEFVATLKQQAYANYQLILIDDGSTDGTAEAVLAELPSTQVIRGDGNLWWAGSLQKGIDYLKEKKVREDSIILMINDDTHIPPDFLAVGASLISGSKKQIFCAQAYSQKTGKLLEAGVRVDWFHYRFIPTEVASEINCLTTRGLFLRFSDVMAIGGFNPGVLPHYYSDYEFTIRAKNKGYELKSPKQLKLWMNEQTTGMQVADSLTLRQYFKKAFQIRSAINPWSGAKFISLAAPTGYKLICYFRLSVWFAKCVVKAAMNGI